jgi:exonuclease SbcD
MKLLHISDLHIGKKVNEFSMLEDQEYILKQILKIADEHNPNGILIAGDIYDKGIPCVEGVTLFDWFLTELYRRRLKVFMVSGNHDSSERIDYGGRIMGENQIHIAGLYQGRLEKITQSDEYGPINFYLLPFVNLLL